MYVRNYECDNGHLTRGTFGSNDAYKKVMDLKMVACETCGSTTVNALPPAPNVNGGTARELDRLFHEKATIRDVGTEFTEEAIAMHEGRKPQENIMGLVNRDDVRELVDNGIDFFLRPKFN